jgi:tRNA threonylcarbamoyladenosine biosynthesis protein TsaE
MTAVEHVSNSSVQTFAWGRALGELLVEGDCVALSGPLGAGKTQFIKGVAAGIGVAEEEPVVSPTFVLVREYLGQLKLYHIDVYRLSGAAELLSLGFEEMLAEPGAVVALEWADRTPEAIPASACRIALAHASPTARRCRVEWADAVRLAALRARLAGGPLVV